MARRREKGVSININTLEKSTKRSNIFTKNVTNSRLMKKTLKPVTLEEIILFAKDEAKRGLIQKGIEMSKL